MSFKQILRNFFLYFIPDKIYLKYHFYQSQGYKLNLNKPQTYNEKLQWIKLHDRNPIYTQMVDKYRVRKIIEEKIGNQYLIPLLGKWKKFSEINFDLLPQKSVLKTNHDSGGVWIIDKNQIDKKQLEKEINRHLKTNFYHTFREWPYKNVKPLIIAEKFIVDETAQDLKDYKFYCFNGKVKLLMRVSNRNIQAKETNMDYYDENMNNVKICWGKPYNEKPLPLPENINEMKALAETLSENIPAVRVDLYTDNTRIYFGEYTFFDGSGFEKIEPIEWDYKLGSYITIV